MAKVHRNQIARTIRETASTGATHVTITLPLEDALLMAEDMWWAVRSTVRAYHADVQGSIRE